MPYSVSIRENICLNHPEADTESIIKVARAAEAHNFIMELPEGYATRIGERGSGLVGSTTKNSYVRTLLQTLVY